MSVTRRSCHIVSALKSPTLAEIGEDQLVATLIRGLSSGPHVRVAAGDDCAVLGPPRAARWHLLKADALVEGVHFLPEADPRRIGWKALCRAISDVAAMGGLPEHALVTLAVHPEVELAWVERLYTGLERAARRFGVSIVGGETSRSPGPLFLNITLTGTVERGRCVRRSGGKPGDALYVTGRLGGSIHGKHLDFIPRLAEARWLTEHFRLHAMMDLSDGLGADLPRLAAASGCGYDLGKVPATPGCSQEQALNDGEDYELLFALDPKQGARLETLWRQAFPKLRLSRVGQLTGLLAAPPEPALPLPEPEPANSLHTRHGFDHFAKRR